MWVEVLINIGFYHIYSIVPLKSRFFGDGRLTEIYVADISHLSSAGRATDL